MTDRFCSTCGAVFTPQGAALAPREDNESSCPACRMRLAEDEARTDLRAVARWQRRLSACVLTGLLVLVFVRLPDVPRSLANPAVWGVWFATRVVVVLSGLQLMRHLHFCVHVGVPMSATALIMLPIIPAGDLAVWALLTVEARRALRRAGVRAGWWGIADEDVCRQLGLCRRCGYNLTGNASGRCPECGTDVPPPPDDERSDNPLAADIERFK